MTFYNEYSLCLGLIIPSFCGELLKKEETPWDSSVSRDFYTFFLNASHTNSSMIDELLRHNIELYNDLMCLNIMPEPYKKENITYKNITTLVKVLEQVEKGICQSIPKKVIFNKVYTLFCYKNNYKFSKDIRAGRDFLVNPNKLLEYLQKQDLKIEFGKKDLDFCL